MNIMKKLVVAILAISFVLALVPMTFVSADAWDGAAIATGFESGTGTEADPFVVKTAAQLAYLAQRVNGVGEVQADAMEGMFVRLDADIDLAGKNWTPIGDNPNTPFSGTFDGNGKLISGLFVDNVDVTADEVSGLFGATITATIKNVNLIGTKVNGGKYVGGLAAYANKGTQLINCSVKIDEVTGEVTGGVAGRMEKLSETTEKRRGLVLFCTFEGNVHGTSEYYKSGRTAYVGGIVGVAGHTDVRYCTNKGSVTTDLGSSAKTPFGGGIIGCTGASSGFTNVDHCINTGTITSKGENAIVGGIAGRSNHVAGGMVVYCVNLGTVKAEDTTTRIGGVTGHHKTGNATASMGYVHNFSVKIGEIPLEGFDELDGYSKQALIDDEFYDDGVSATIPRSCKFLEASTVKLADLKGYTADYWTEGTVHPEPKKDAILAKISSDSTWFETEPAAQIETPTTEATTTEKPVQTTKPEDEGTTKPTETTKAPGVTTEGSATEKPEEKGCGGMLAGSFALLAIVTLGGVMLKKRD